MVGKTTADGYGGDHQAERRRWQRRLDQGEAVQCSRSAEAYCSGLPIGKGDAWELDHTDDRTAYLGPAHPVCNRTAAAVKVHSGGMTVRDW